MSPDPQPAAQSRREAAWPIPVRPGAAPVEPLQAYLDAVRQGLLMIDAGGTVIAANSPARRLLADLSVGLRTNAAAVPLMRAVRGGPAPSRRAAFLALRRSLDRRQPAVFELRRAEHTVQAELQPLPDGGWVMTLEDVSTRKAIEARADAMARLDPLTGLPNRLLPARAPRRGPRPPRARRRGLRPAADRSRPVQAGQRHARPSDRRRPAGEGRRPPALDGPADRYGGADRRRRVRDPAGGRARRGGHAGAGPPRSST